MPRFHPDSPTRYRDPISANTSMLIFLANILNDPSLRDATHTEDFFQSPLSTHYNFSMSVFDPVHSRDFRDALLGNYLYSIDHVEITISTENKVLGNSRLFIIKATAAFYDNEDHLVRLVEGNTGRVAKMTVNRGWRYELPCPDSPPQGGIFREPALGWSMVLEIMKLYIHCVVTNDDMTDYQLHIHPLQDFESMFEESLISAIPLDEMAYDNDQIRPGLVFLEELDEEDAEGGDSES
ncbi:hypothetical protein G7Y89_g15398 [Cudoniella acicularis]|uniref:Uncharacterized protein n=1 Tax=Cudoniella acicularis TaxID=354080 RepID=A0A8H4VNB0_9HELO|nr:hypothetical protein G7Y89_g15398 [Cudoniella acicularis]